MCLDLDSLSTFDVIRLYRNSILRGQDYQIIQNLTCSVYTEDSCITSIFTILYELTSFSISGASTNFFFRVFRNRRFLQFLSGGPMPWGHRYFLSTYNIYGYCNPVAFWWGFYLFWDGPPFKNNNFTLFRITPLVFILKILFFWKWYFSLLNNALIC